MNVLLFGSDSCTHALAWKLINSAAVHELIVAPGNHGTSFFAPSAALAVDDPSAIVSFALSESLDLVLSDPHAIAAGVPNEIHALSIPVCGSDRALARWQTSRCAAREWVQTHGLPVPRGYVCTRPQQAEQYAATFTQPVMVLADDPLGPAIVCMDQAAATNAIAQCFAEQPGTGVIVQEWIRGPLVTASLLTDGLTGYPVPATRVYSLADHLCGVPVGVHSAATPVWHKLNTYLDQAIRYPLMAALQTDGSGARGWIGATCVVGPRGPLIQSLHLVPSGAEVAATLPRLADDLLPLLLGCARGTLSTLPAPRWTDEATVGVGIYQASTAQAPSDLLARALAAFEPGTITFYHAPATTLSNPYVPRAARFGNTRIGRLATATSTHTLAQRAHDPLLALIVASGLDLPTAREQVYANLRRSALPTTMYRADIGAHDL